MSIEFACPYCEKVSTVPDAFAGQKGRCPGCQKVIEVPDPSSAGSSAGSEPATGASAANAPTVVDVAAPPPLPRSFEPSAPTRPVFAASPPPLPSSAPPVAASAPPAIPGFDIPRGAVGEPVAPVAAPATAGSPIQDVAAMKSCPRCGEQIRAAARKCKFCGEFIQGAGRRAPRATPTIDLPLASPGSRLAAYVIDGALIYLPLTLGIIAGTVYGMNNRGNVEPVVAGLVGIGGLVMFLVLCVQWYLIATRGATLAKGWLGLKIVRLDGTEVGFVDGVILRSWVIGFIMSAANLMYMGCIVWLVDSLMVFAQDRRTLHDHIASTVVIDVSQE